MFSLFKKPQLTWQNHFQHHAERSGNERHFEVQLGPLTRGPQIGFHEAVEAAHQIALQHHGKKLALCLSGGVDSESMLRAFLQARVNFDIFFMRFANDLNMFDIKTNITLCSSLGLSFKFIDLDVVRFFESSQHMKYAEKYRCQSPQIATHLWLLEQLDAIPVLSGNPFARSALGENNFFIGLPGDLHCAYFRYFEKTQRNGVPWFFIYTPELCASFLRTPTTLQFSSSGQGPEGFTYLHKCRSYQEAGFKVSPRENKYTGFELVRKHYDQVCKTEHGTGFDQLFREPMVKLNPFPDSYAQKVPVAYFRS